jgi:glycosyltransferase involved in cell wall biosynthesis
MRIAIIGSVLTTIPPDGQASVERLAYYQAEGFGTRGHQVTLYAPHGSASGILNVHTIDVGLAMKAAPPGAEGKDAEEVYGGAYATRARMANDATLLTHLIVHQNEFDVVLNNSFDEAPIFASHPDIHVPMYHIMHVPIIPQAAEVFREHKTHLIPISNAQKKAFADLNYAKTVYNCVDTNEFAFSETPGSYLLYLGSIGRNKNPKDAILAAKETGNELRIGGKLKDRAYYEKEIAPLVDGKQIIWMGELHPQEVVKLYQGAKAFLFPTLWEEPFGLVVIEAMSCGTPVIAYPNGGLPEIVQDGVNGYLVHDRKEMDQKIPQLDKIDRNQCRKSVLDRFSVDQMVEGYLSVLAQK